MLPVHAMVDDLAARYPPNAHVPRHDGPGLSPHGPTRLVAYLGGTLVSAVVVAGLGCVLSYVAELAQDYPTRSRTAMQGIVALVAVLHLLLLTESGMCTWRCVASAVALATHATLLAGFPLVRATSPRVWASVFACIASNVLWFHYFLHDEHGREETTWAVLGFFAMMVWLVPFGFSCTLALDDQALPPASATTVGIDGPVGGHARRPRPGQWLQDLLRAVAPPRRHRTV